MAETWVDQGGYLSNTKLSKKFVFSSQPLEKFRQFTDIKSALGKHEGESVNWMRVADLGTFGGRLTETNTMHESTQAKSWGTLTMYEEGNSIPFTQKVTTLSKFELEKIITGGLKDDKAKCLDGLVEREFNQTKLRYVGTATGGYVLTTNGTATATNTSILNTYHVRKMILELKKRNVPGYGKLGGDYVMICSHEAMEGLTGALESIYQYSDRGLKKLLEGEMGRYYGVRFVEDGFASRFTYSSTARTATAKSWTGTKSLDAYLFGGETVKEAIAIPEEIRVKEKSDYGRSHGLAWYFLGGFKIYWDTAANSRIIKWDSA
ncbi:hypothetical protein LCGC14_0467300 [marine sediment metagenome]|uniref:Bacteriophage Mu GpT domain-containing protein n=1 Tax=marine sediment metagenome TaxID=412755 RepID=A0A0F9SW74_9ZZZZ